MQTNEDEMSQKLSILSRSFLDSLEDNIIPQPRIIHVETRSKCNGKCGFCPANVKSDKREDVYMPEELIDKIVSELEQWDYSNRLSFYNNNEPFLDKRIYETIKKARQSLPKAYLEIKSNGITLNMDNVLQIFNAGLDMLYINDYSESGNHRESVRKIIEENNKIRRLKGHFDGQKYHSRLNVSLGSIDEIKGTRGGLSPNREALKDPIIAPCFRPVEMMTISPEGKVSVCSEDFHYSIEMGNVKDQSLLEIWESDKWSKLRVALLNGDRNYTGVCSRCSYNGFSREMLEEFNLIGEGEEIRAPIRYLENKRNTFFKKISSLLSR